MKKQILLFIISAFLSIHLYSQETYVVGKTEYFKDKKYVTTGKPMVKRSDANKKEYLKSIGLTEVPNGYEVDHIIPLSEGGTDDPSNMQLLTIKQHDKKTARERRRISKSNYSSTKNYTPKKHTYKKPKTIIPVYSHTSTTGRVIYTGKRGGKYYLNSSGKKVYIKSTTKKSTKPRKTYSTRSSTYRTIHTGPRGGKYYINSNGNKTYVKKK